MGNESRAGSQLGFLGQDVRSLAQAVELLCNVDRYRATGDVGCTAQRLRHSTGMPVQRKVADPQIPRVDGYRIGDCLSPFRGARERVEFQLVLLSRRSEARASHHMRCPIFSHPRIAGPPRL
jgi:hypothetical protein